MRVFVTGASGFIGTAVTKELLAHGHKVVGLARSDEAANRIKASGGEVLRGSLEDLDILTKGASESDGVIHLGFVHDFADYPKCANIDKRAIETMGSALKGTNKPLVVTAGTLSLKHGQLATEDDEKSGHPAVFGGLRVSEATGLPFSAQGVRATAILLPPTVHDAGDHGFIPMLINSAKKNGASVYIDEGKNRWPAVHRQDAASLYRLALEKGVGGQRYHGVGEQGVATREIAETIARGLKVPAVSKTAEEAKALLGFLGVVFPMDNPTSNALTKQRLGWEPKHIGLLEDMKLHYFQ